MDRKKSTGKMAKALAEFKFRRLRKHIFMEPRDCDEITLCKILFFVRGRDYWRNKADWGRTKDQKMVAVHGSPCESTPLILMFLMCAGCTQR
jgi:hypothetical protein